MTEMRQSGTVIQREPLTQVSQIQWGPIIGGGLVAAGFASVLQAFGAAVGLAVSSTSPTWRDASSVLWILSGIYLILVALASYGLGGYIAGRTLGPARESAASEIEIRDGEHGLLTWAIATLLTIVIIALTASSFSRLGAPSSGTGPTASLGAENIVAYDLDKLFRSDRRSSDQSLNYARAEAGRILLTSSGHRGVTADDRTYLARLVSERTGLPPTEAQRRADTSIANAKENISRARHSTVILAFMAAAAAFLGAVAAWFAAVAGGQHRDAGEGYVWSTRGWWGNSHPRSRAL